MSLFPDLFPNIEVTSLTENLADPVNVKAFATVRVDTVGTIDGIRVVQQPNQRAWVQLPPFHNLTETTKQHIQDAVLSLFMESR